MPRITVTPDQLREVSRKFLNASSQSDTMVRDLQVTINALAPDFEGMTKQSFYNQFETWKTSMSQFVTLLDAISKQLDAIAARFEAADQAS